MDAVEVIWRGETVGHLPSPVLADDRLRGLCWPAVSAGGEAFAAAMLAADPRQALATGKLVRWREAGAPERDGLALGFDAAGYLTIRLLSPATAGLLALEDALR